MQCCRVKDDLRLKPVIVIASGRIPIPALEGRIMIRAKVWFRCVAMHDPVMPVLVKPAVIGWQGKYRDIDLVIERDLKGPELLLRMKGWITVDPKQAVKVFEKHGRLKCFDNGELVVEVEDQAQLDALERDLEANFADQCAVESIPRDS
jgi:hypothetical protein